MIKNYFLFLIAFLGLASYAYSQNPRTTITITDKSLSVASYTDKEVVMNSQTDLHLTAAATVAKTVLSNSVIKLNSVNSWVFFDNIRPQFVIDSLLQYIYVNNQAAVLKTNVRVSIYKHGAVVIPQASTFQPLKVYTGQNFTGDSASYSMFTFYNSLGTKDNKIRSFKLKRGYMVTLATTSDGTGYSRVYIADDKDLEISVMPNLLDNSISFIRVLDWEWVSKKGWCGYNPNDLNLTKATWRYDWSASGSTTSTVEYVPIRQNGGWPGWSEINGKQYVSHVLAFNEPDHTEQSNLTVAQAVAQWPDMLRTGLRVGSPACTNFSWLYQFMDSCKAHNYRVDYVAVHAYWGGTSPANWYNDLKYI
ncbi:MAG TPA: glycosyl hydrolase, partial [Paludibacter sp.]